MPGKEGAIVKGKPRFRVGQVVGLLNTDPVAFEKILSGPDETYGTYRTESGDWDEQELRDQTSAERGPERKS